MSANRGRALYEGGRRSNSGQRVITRAGPDLRVRSDHKGLGRHRRLGAGGRLWLPAIFRLRRLHEYCHRSCVSFRDPTSREFSIAILINQRIRVLDALAYVTFILDKGLPVLAASHGTLRAGMALLCAVLFHGHFRIVARCSFDVHLLGGLSRLVASGPQAMAGAGAALGLGRWSHFGSAWLGCDIWGRIARMDHVPGSGHATSNSDV